MSSGFPGAPRGDELPVNRVNFFEAIDFCTRLSASGRSRALLRRHDELLAVENARIDMLTK